jgi:hypothetical protein
MINEIGRGVAFDQVFACDALPFRCLSETVGPLFEVVDLFQQALNAVMAAFQPVERIYPSGTAGVRKRVRRINIVDFRKAWDIIIVRIVINRFVSMIAGFVYLIDGMEEIRRDVVKIVFVNVDGDVVTVIAGDLDRSESIQIGTVMIFSIVAYDCFIPVTRIDIDIVVCGRGVIAGFGVSFNGEEDTGRGEEAYVVERGHRNSPGLGTQVWGADFAPGIPQP